MFMKENQLKICPCHDKKVSLIFTFKFIGAEYWCPHCGYTQGIFGAAQTVDASDEMLKQHKDYKKKATPFLSGETEEWHYEGREKK